MSYFTLNNISKKYSETFELDKINLSIKAGEIVGLLGESGAGKSTLLRIAAGLIDADSGVVKIGGEKMPLASDRLVPGYDNVKMVSQEFQLSAPLTVAENIAYALRYYKEAYRKERVSELIDLCHLENVAHQPVKFISGGEKQRTAIAKALAEEAKVLLLDEPFAHLDLINKRRLAEAITNVVKKLKIACIFVTHDAIDALRISHQVGILKGGKLIQIATPQQVYYEPVNIYVAQMTGEVSFLSKTFFEKHFAEKPAHQIEEKIYMLRPEQLKIVADGGITMEVKRVFFEGNHYKFFLKKDQYTLLVYHANKLPVGSIVGIE